MTARVVGATIGPAFESDPPTYGWECAACHARSQIVWEEWTKAEAAAHAHNAIYHRGERGG